MDFAFRLFSFLKALIPAAVILLPIMFYYLYRRNLLRTKKDILLKEIEQGSIVDPEMLAKSLTNPVTEEHRLQNSLRIGIIFTFAGVVIAVATAIFYSYAEAQFGGAGWDASQMITLTFVVTLVLVVAAIVLGVGIAYLVSYFNQKKKMNKTA
jgi:ABC-type Fe3+ transport system permease subunit